MSDDGQCQATTRSGERCKNSAGPSGYCHLPAHGGEVVRPVTFEADEALTLKQRLFVEAYMGDAAGNATQAFKDAGYAAASDNSAAVQAHHLLRNPKIRKAIEARLKEDDLVLSRKELLWFWTQVALGMEPEHGVTMHGKAYTKVPKVKDRLKASELLGKFYGLLKEVVELDDKRKRDVQDAARLEDMDETQLSRFVSAASQDPGESEDG